MTTNFDDGVRASRLRVPRTRGAISGLLLMVLGAWAALVPFIGPYFDFGFLPDPNTAWHWTAARGWLEVAPGAAAFLGGLILLISANRLTASLGGWLAAAGGAWLVVGPSLASQIPLSVGAPDPAANSAVQMLEQLFYFYAVGAAIVFFAAFALGRLSVHGVREAQAAARRAEEERLAEERRVEEERRAAEQRRMDEEQRGAEHQRATEEQRAAGEQRVAQPGQPVHDGVAGGPAPAPTQAGPRHERAPGEQPTYTQQPTTPPPPPAHGEPTATYPGQRR